jgi:uncharacterized protein
MHINVRDILVESVGYSRTYKVSGERPSLQSVRLTQEVEGELIISRLNESVLVRGQLRSEIELECHRCLSTFTRPIKIGVAQEYAKSLGDDQMLLVDDTIDIAPLMEQEIILSLPIKIICRPDCPGLKAAAQMYTKSPDTGVRLENRAHITKGTKRGRT